MVKTIDELKAVLGVVNPNRFNAKILFPAVVPGIEATNLTDVYIMSTSVPTKDLGVIEIPVKGGSTLKIPGDEVYGDWTCTIMLDKDMKIYRAIDTWMELIKSPLTGLKLNDLASIMATIQLEQLDGAGGVIQTWQLLLAFPTSLGEVTMAKEEKDSYSQFDVTFAYSLRTTDSAL